MTWYCLFSGSSGFSHKNPGQGLEIEIATDGSYNIIIDGTKWLTSGETWFRSDGATASVAGGNLKLLRAEAETGWDVIGSWQGISFMYKITGGAEEVFILAEIRVYTDKEVVRWGQVSASYSLIDY